MSKSKMLQDMYDRHYGDFKESVCKVDNFPKEVKVNEGQTVYKLKHKDSGLYFDPQGYQGNVSEVGKVYSNKKPPRQSFIKVPNEVKVETSFDLTALPKGKRYGSYKTKLDDWTVEEYKLVKIDKGESD